MANGFFDLLSVGTRACCIVDRVAEVSSARGQQVVTKFMQERESDPSGCRVVRIEDPRLVGNDVGVEAIRRANIARQNARIQRSDPHGREMQLDGVRRRLES
jgi:hypothetical protein